MRVKLYLSFIFLLAYPTVRAQVSVSFPPARMVYQRDPAGHANVFVTGTYFGNQVTRIEARLNTRGGEPGNAINWTTIASSLSNGTYGGFLNSTGGRFDLEVRAMNAGNQQVGDVITVEKVGVGEVFLIVGHSNAAAAEGAMTGAASDLVNSINPMSNPGQRNLYLQTGSPDDLPPLEPTHLCQSCGIAPMADQPWFWPKLGDSLVKALNVPILFYSAAFGGSNMGHFYKAAYDIPFSHGFIKYNIRMPYVNIRNTLNKYVPRTGLRAVLSAHGINDGDTTGAGFYFRSLKVMEKSRNEANYQELAWMVATSCYNDGVKPEITNAQNDLINTVPNTFRGADLNAIGNEGRYDKLHFNEQGQRMAAGLWRDAIINPSVNILGNAKSLMASAPPLPPPPLPVTLVSFNGKKTLNGFNELEWVTSSETSNDYFEIQKSIDAVRFAPVGIVKGVGDSKEENRYHFTDESPAPRTTYYRLNQVDFDGTATLSRIIAIKSDSEESASSVYPNPTQHVIEVSTSNGSAVSRLKVMDLNGKILLEQSQGNELDVSGLNRGEYIVEFNAGGELVRKKISKL
ncbi:T9SS type A sorting domain-containing protein [Dyadobacter sp. CY261]|uniref:T9SS type A sorting domain-containing protein n=1 Tax=Dyadobacter sp. CY261 TaxID=2907203 RepID=UPI001F1C7DC2|nr:T9SS type A sorting domain-containing protein [Dyadobacter sp. CY261]MCF0070490.1 T9SS type A sorting domain-containing protein [Dyadobacter sp. CY261]